MVGALRESGLEVPRDIAVTGHDHWGMVASQTRPPLTTIDMNLEELGRLAARLLFSAIDGDFEPGLHSVNTRLVVRGSTVPGS